MTVHVHGQEVLSEETVHLGPVPGAPRELQDPIQTSTSEQSQEETTHSLEQEAAEEQSAGSEEELRPPEIGEKPQPNGMWPSELWGRWRGSSSTKEKVD